MAPAIIFGLAIFLLNYRVPGLPLGSLAVLAFSTVIAYAAVRHRLMDIDLLVIRAGGVVFPMIVLAVPLIAGSLWFQHTTLGRLEPFASLGTALTLVLGMLCYARARLYVEHALERSLFPARYRARRAVEQFSKEIVEVAHGQELGRELTTAVTNGLGLVGAALYVRNDDAGFHREAVAGSLAGPERLEAQPSEELSAAPGEWELTVPIPGRERLAGFIALGQKASGAAIDDLDQTLLTMIASQVGVALKNLQYLRDIEAQKGAIERQKAEIEELKRRVEAENVVLRAEVRQHSAFREIIGSSAALQRALSLVEKAANSHVSILITGETGTGKELIARAIHELSERRHGPLISVNCPAIPHDLAEAELFGSERGAFTGAVTARPGRFELADGGTIFLDEIADLPLLLQTKLLRVLQEREVQRLGGSRVIKLDVRVVAATNRDLRRAIARGEFREDLYHRLAAIVAELPALRERAGDIEMLASYFLERAATTHQKPIVGFTAEALTALRAYSWPGNIRELQNVIERAVLLCDGAVILPVQLGDLGAESTAATGLTLSLREEKARRIQEALIEARGNQAEAARRLGVTRSNLARMMKSLGLKNPRTLQ